MTKKVLGMQPFHGKEDLPPEYREWIAGADRTNAELAGVQLVVVRVDGALRPEIHLTFALPCAGEKGGYAALRLELSLEDGVLLRESLASFLDNPEAMEKVAKSLEEG